MSNTRNYSDRINKFSNKILVCVTTLMALVREYPIAAVLKPSLKSYFISECGRFSRKKIWPLEN